MRYAHVIWDWNGTLLDDAWLCIEVMNQLLAEQRLPLLTPDRYAWVFGFPLREYCRRLGFQADRPSYEQLSGAFAARYEARRLECRLRHGARETLAAAQNLGVRQSLLSAYSHERLRELVPEFGLSEVFDAVLGADNPYGRGKADLGRQHLSALGLPAAAVLLVGDTLYDHQVARAIGVDCVLLASGHQHHQRLQSTGARVVHGIGKIRGLIERDSRRYMELCRQGGG